MEAVVKEWGNSLALRLPKSMLKELNVKKDTKVELKIEGNRIVIEPKKDDTLKNMLKKITDKNLHKEIDFGKPMGKEVW